ncbi:hypothetical protein BJV82DRAFT_606870 [Fennellomyces sp. T-0311]|nr:hypothetical protein BJV82DRAFT_606870 [Fennellomyces sp. T-0311]
MSSELDFETYLGMRPNDDHTHRNNSASPPSFTSPQLSLGSLDQSATSGPAVSSSDFSLDDLEHMFDWGDIPQQQRQQHQQQQQQQQQQGGSPHSHSDPVFLSDFSPASSATLSPPTDLLHHQPEELTTAGQSIQAEARKAFVGGYFPAFNEQPCFVETYSMGGPMPGIAIPATPAPEGPNSLSPSSSSGSSATHASWPVLDQWYRNAAPTVPTEATMTNTQTVKEEPKNWRKRTASNSSADLNQHLWRLEPNQQIKKVAHNAIERRYRNNINDRIQDLKNVVPALYRAKIKEKTGGHDGDDDSDEDSGEQEIVEGVEVAKKLNKATILRKATEYILFLRQTNDLADRENQILQHIISQMPGGNQVLTQFLSEKRQFQQSEQDRLARERKEAHAREQIQRQELLRERAAQRAALAQLMPKRERRPYRRRKKADTGSKKSSQAASAEQDNGSRMFMAMYMCVAFFSTSPFGKTTTATTSSIPHHHASRVAFENTTMSSSTLDLSSSGVSWDTWFWVKMMLYAAGIIYFAVIPLINRFLQPRPVSKKIADCSGHHHYATEVSDSWHQLYEALVTLSSASGKPSQLLYGIFSDMLVFAPFSRSFAKFFKGSSVGSVELANAGAWVRLSELQCLGGDSTISKLERIRSCTGMLASIHSMERDSRRDVLLRPRTLARVYTTAAVQMELVFGPNNRLSTSYWKRAIEKDEGLQEEWLHSNGHKQLMHMMATRSGYEGNCTSTFYSFVLPYLTAPLDWMVYWQTLSQLQRTYVQLIERTVMDNDKKEALFDSSMLPATNESPIDHMISWWVHLGMALESTNDDLSSLQLAMDGSMLLKRHCRSLTHLVQAIAAAPNQTNVVEQLEEALEDPLASIDGIKYIANHETNDEAVLLSLSTLAAHLTAYHTLSDIPDVSQHLVQLKEHLRIDMELLESSKLISESCRKQINSKYIS